MIELSIIFAGIGGFFAGHFFGFAAGMERTAKRAELELDRIPDLIMIPKEGQPAPSETD